MKADDNTMTREERNRLHMERVRAVHRRSAIARVSARLAYIDALEREAKAGLRAPPTARVKEERAALVALLAELKGAS